MLNFSSPFTKEIHLISFCHSESNSPPRPPSTHAHSALSFSDPKFPILLPTGRMPFPPHQYIIRSGYFRLPPMSDRHFAFWYSCHGRACYKALHWPGFSIHRNLLATSLCTDKLNQALFETRLRDPSSCANLDIPQPFINMLIAVEACRKEHRRRTYLFHAPPKPFVSSKVQ
jgi:hypothetical protein